MPGQGLWPCPGCRALEDSPSQALTMDLATLAASAPRPSSQARQDDCIIHGAPWEMKTRGPVRFQLWWEQQRPWGADVPLP